MVLYPIPRRKAFMLCLYVRPRHADILGRHSLRAVPQYALKAEGISTGFDILQGKGVA